MEFFRKVRAKARKSLHFRDRGGSHESDGEQPERLPPAMDDTYQSSTSKNTNLVSYQSFPASRQDTTHRTQTHKAKARDRERFASTAVSSQPTNTCVGSSHQPSNWTTIPVPSTTPWEAWTLDRQFLSDVYAWNIAHPEDTFHRMAKKISASIEEHSILLELAPDGSIPIRGFVKAVAHVVKLGSIIIEAKGEALLFAQNVFQWVEKLAAAFQDHEGGNRFISKTWQDLADIRESIEDACKWAHEILADEDGLMKRTTIKDQISGFQKQFSENIEQFGVVSHIRIAIGQDYINRQLETLIQSQDHLVSMQMAQMPAVPNVTYQFQNKIPCDPGTRKQVLEEIMSWICDISEGSPCFFWLSGDPGVGKSAVTASTAKECRRRKILWAQFFINRNDASTIDPQLYFPSIVKQMSEHKPTVGYAIQNILKEQPDLMKDDMAIQATELFLKAVQAASELTPREPVAIVIDALDETDLKRLKVTSEIFSRILVDLPHNVKVFISSRVEDVIRDNFAHHPRARNIHLSARTSVADVTRFLEVKVQEIMAEYKIKWSEWGEERMQKLCIQASGLFIWAVTAIEYIRTEIKESGRESLGVVLDELNAKGMGDIDMLYRAILKRTYRDTDPWQTQRFRRIVGAILVQQSPLSIADLQGLLDLRNPTSGAPVDVEHFVRRLRTLLVAGVAEINSQTFPRAHKSFTDFITSPKAEEFRVDMTESNGELAIQCIHQLTQFWKLRHQMPPPPRYAITHWSSHLTHVAGVPVEAEETEDEAASSDEVQSLASNPEKDMDASITVDPKLTKKLASYTYMYSISISPDRSRIAYARGKSVLLRDVEVGNFIGSPLDGHTKTVNSVTFSPDGKYIASTSDDRSIRVWDVETGKLLRVPLTGHQNWVLAATFSPDGSQIVSGSRDQAIRIWEVETGRCMHILEGHAGRVYSAIFSPAGTHIVSASSDKTVCVWDALTGGKVHVFNDHTTKALFAFFSPNSKHIISCSEAGTIIVWDFETRKRIPNGSIGGASLSFANSSSSYIITPQVSNTAPVKSGAPSSPPYSSSFQVAGAGIAGGIANSWLYSEKEFIMSMCLGQLTMRPTFSFFD